MEAYLQTLPITLAQFLKWCGVAENGAQAKEMVRRGMAKLNGQLCTIPGKQLVASDIVEVSGQVWQILNQSSVSTYES